MRRSIGLSKAVFFLLLLNLLGISSAQPATAPAWHDLPGLDEAQAAYISAATNAEKAKSHHATILKASPSYRDAQADLAARQAVLEDARANGSAQEKLDASAAMVKSKAVVAAIEKKAITDDAELTKAMDEWKAAIERFDALSEANQQKKSKWQKEQREAEEADKVRAITLKQLEITGDKYKHSQVRIQPLIFQGADNRFLDKLPGVMTSTDGVFSTINTEELHKWIGFAVSDDDGESCSYLFAKKEAFADRLVPMKPGTKIDVCGTVIELVLMPGTYGIVCDRIVVTRNEAAKP